MLTPSGLPGSIATPLVGVEVLDGEAQGGAGHRRGVRVEEGPQPLGVALARLTDPAADGGLDEVLRVVDQQLRDREGVVKIAAPDEGPGGGDRGPALPRRRGAREVVERFTGLVGEIATDDRWRGSVDQVPVVDAVVAPQVERVQGLPRDAGRDRRRASKSMMLTAPTRCACTGLSSRISICSRSIPTKRLASAKISPIRTPSAGSWATNSSAVRPAPSRPVTAPPPHPSFPYVLSVCSLKV